VKERGIEKKGKLDRRKNKRREMEERKNAPLLFLSL
jgi:hypothetical protein